MNAQTIDMIPPSPVDLALQSRQLELHKELILWGSVRGIFDPIVNALLALGIEATYSYGSLTVSFAGDKQKFYKVFRLLRLAGFTFDAERPKLGATSWNAFWDHSSRAEGTRVYFNFSSSICRRVKVGTKMVEQDVYETVCADLEVLPAPDEAPAPAAIEQDLQF